MLAVVENKRAQPAYPMQQSVDNGDAFLRFEKLTLVPLQKKLFCHTLLSTDDVAWIDTYHAKVREEVLPLMRTDRGREWLEEATLPLRQSIS